MADVVRRCGEPCVCAWLPVDVSRARFLQLAIYAAATFMSVLNYSVLTPIYMYGLDRFAVSLPHA